MSADFHFFRILWLGLINDVILVYCFITELFTLGEGEIMERTPQSISIATVTMINSYMTQYLVHVNHNRWCYSAAIYVCVWLWV